MANCWAISVFTGILRTDAKSNNSFSERPTCISSSFYYISHIPQPLQVTQKYIVGLHVCIHDMFITCNVGLMKFYSHRHVYPNHAFSLFINMYCSFVTSSNSEVHIVGIPVTEY